VAAIDNGPVFWRVLRGYGAPKDRLGDRSVALILKWLATKVGLDPSRYAVHSLRSGYPTSAAQNRAGFFKMADPSRRKSLDALREYVRNEERFDDHAADGLLGPEKTSAGASWIAIPRRG
jgi:hypothetical protein